MSRTEGIANVVAWLLAIGVFIYMFYGVFSNIKSVGEGAVIVVFLGILLYWLTTALQMVAPLLVYLIYLILSVYTGLKWLCIAGRKYYDLRKADGRPS